MDDELEKTYRAHIKEGSEAIKRELRSYRRREKLIAFHKEAHRRIVGDHLGKAAVIDKNGVIRKEKETAKFPIAMFHRWFCMSPDLFQRIFEDIIILVVPIYW